MGKPVMLVLPVLTLTLIELGYVLRITRTSMVETMRSPYIRTAFLKGLPYWKVVFKHAVRNALIAPITVIMLHVNWLLGGIVIVEVVFGFPGIGAYLLESALYKDFNALEAGSMIMVFVAVSTQLIADIVYTFLNPRIDMTEEKQGGKHTVLDGLFILFASKTAMIGLIIVLFWIFVAVCAPLLTRYSPVEQDWKASNQGPPGSIFWARMNWAGICGPDSPMVPESFWQFFR